MRLWQFVAVMTNIGLSSDRLKCLMELFTVHKELVTTPGFARVAENADQVLLG
jgi:hypothetical protein